MAVNNTDIIDAIRGVEYPVARAKDVAEQVPIGQRAVLNRLDNLVDEGRVERLDVGARSAVFWVADDEPEQAELVERVPFDHVEKDELDDTPVPVHAPGDDLDDVGDALVMAAKSAGAGDELLRVDGDFELDLPGSGTKLEQRRQAVVACVRYLADRGVATRAEFIDDVFPDHKGRYQSGNSWWKNCVMDGLTQVAEASDAVEKPDYAGDWRYTA